MGRVRNLRLPDAMEDDVDKYLVDNKIKFTDLVISGVTSIIYQDVKKQSPDSVPSPDIADTVYEPDPARPVKQPKASSKAAPIVKSLLSGIVKQPTVSHHPCCSCGVCKP